MDFSRRTLVLYLTYLLFLFMMTSSITAGHTVTTSAWNHPSTAYTGLIGNYNSGVAACALIFGLLFGVAGLIMTITGANDANIAPEEVLIAEGRDTSSPLLDIIGPVFLGVGVASLIAGVSMCMYARYPTRRGQGARAAANRGREDCEDQT